MKLVKALDDIFSKDAETFKRTGELLTVSLEKKWKDCALSKFFFSWSCKMFQYKRVELFGQLSFQYKSNERDSVTRILLF